jgi:hypothetical protein
MSPTCLIPLTKGHMPGSEEAEEPPTNRRRQAAFAANRATATASLVWIGALLKVTIVTRSGALEPLCAAFRKDVPDAPDLGADAL